MACGATGVGKSTVMNAIISGGKNMFKNKDCNIEAKIQLINTNGDRVFQIGHLNTSCTRIPGFYKKDEIVFVDCPGL